MSTSTEWKVDFPLTSPLIGKYDPKVCVLEVIYRCAETATGCPLRILQSNHLWVTQGRKCQGL